MKASGPFTGLFLKTSEEARLAAENSDNAQDESDATPAPKKHCGPTTKAARQAAKVARDTQDAAKPAERPKQVKKAPLPKKRKYAPKTKAPTNPSDPSNGNDGNAPGASGASVTV